MSKIRADIYADQSGDQSVEANYIIHGTAKAWGSWSASSLRGSFNISGHVDVSAKEDQLTFSSVFLSNRDFSIACSSNSSTTFLSGVGSSPLIPWKPLVDGISFYINYDNATLNTATIHGELA